MKLSDVFASESEVLASDGHIHVLQDGRLSGPAFPASQGHAHTIIGGGQLNLSPDGPSHKHTQLGKAQMTSVPVRGELLGQLGELGVEERIAFAQELGQAQARELARATVQADVERANEGPSVEGVMPTL